MEHTDFRDRQEKLVARQIILAYLKNVEAHLGDDRLYTLLGEAHSPDEYLMRGLEEMANITEGACMDFRQSLIRPLLNRSDVKPEDLPINLEKAVESAARVYIWVQENLMEY